MTTTVLMPATESFHVFIDHPQAREVITRAAVGALSAEFRDQGAGRLFLFFGDQGLVSSLDRESASQVAGTGWCRDRDGAGSGGGVHLD